MSKSTVGISQVLDELFLSAISTFFEKVLSTRNCVHGFPFLDLGSTFYSPKEEISV